MSERSRARSAEARPLTAAEIPQVAHLIAADPAVHCFIDARLRAVGGEPWRLGGDLWGFVEDGRVRAALYAGANLVPVATDPRSRAAFADRLRQQGRRCSSIVGPADEVHDLWRLLEPAWGSAREIRANQPFLCIDGPAAVPADASVRAVRLEELDVLLPACVAMFTEEVGVSPVAGGSGPAYRARVSELVRDGRALASFDDRGIAFKAEIGVATPLACQVQGVWVRPDLRGTGRSAAGMAAVVGYARERIAPLVSLYVNDFNTPARKAYAAAGFTQRGTFATVLF